LQSRTCLAGGVELVRSAEVWHVAATARNAGAIATNSVRLSWL